MDNGGVKKNGQDGAAPGQSKPWAFILVLAAILCVTVIFVVVWLTPALEIFTQSSQVIAALTSTFGVIGTLVGTYFGIKSTGDAKDTVERVHRETTEPLRDAAREAASAAKTAADAAARVAPE